MPNQFSDGNDLDDLDDVRAARQDARAAKADRRAGKDTRENSVREARRQDRENLKKARTAASLPKVKQCRDAESTQFGAVAVKVDQNRWGIMHPTQGGHWADDSEVKGWDVCT